jgi:hypothetical protein
MYPVYSGMCLSRIAVYNLVEKHGKRFADDEQVEKGAWKWVRQQSKDFCAAGLDAVVKGGDKCISVGGGYVEKSIHFLGSNITCFTFYIHV